MLSYSRVMAGFHGSELSCYTLMALHFSSKQIEFAGVPKPVVLLNLKNGAVYTVEVE